MAIHRVRALLTTAALLGAAAVSACSGGGGGGGGGGGTGPGPTTGSISGQVSAAGVGVPGAQVSIPNASPQATSASGGFRFDGLNPGSYAVSVQAPQDYALGTGEPASKSVNVAAGQTATVNWSVARTGGGQNAVITTEDMRFSPSTVTIPVGGTVSFVYSAGVGHDVTPQT
ncbi:MAG TPA: carboxypeptidase regulatory-like domain-containing protein, partial [Longimicrobiaceae bacterium]